MATDGMAEGLAGMAGNSRTPMGQDAIGGLVNASADYTSKAIMHPRYSSPANDPAFFPVARPQQEYLGKAGAKRWRGVRPTVRGVAMNPVDHPHGGGEGRTSGGRHPVTPWGVPTKGYKTRKNKTTDKFVVRKRSGK